MPLNPVRVALENGVVVIAQENHLTPAISLLATIRAGGYDDPPGREGTAALTARVLVNRVWLHHFGKGLVATASDFGVRCEPPTHPALLDYLAARFVEDGWSIKKLHRLILLSATYQQSSQTRPACAKIDPENALLHRMNRHRLDFEALRDSILLVSGTLDRTMGGKSVDITKEPFPKRRTVYAFI